MSQEALSLVKMKDAHKKLMMVLFDHKPTESDHLEIKKGEVLAVIEENSNLIKGKLLSGKIGWVRKDLVREYTKMDKILFSNPHLMPFFKILFNDWRLIDWLMTTPGIEFEPIAKGLTYTFQFNNTILPLIGRAIAREVTETKQSNTLFRGNSLVSKTMKHYASIVGIRYLQRTIKEGVYRVCQYGKPLEVDPSKMEGKDRKSKAAKNLKALCEISDVFLDSIHNSLDYMPVELRHICHYLKGEVSKKFRDHVHIAIVGFLFLRFIVPAIVTPDRLEVGKGNLDMNASRRSLLLVSKVIQNVSTGKDFKEEFLQEINPYIQERFQQLKQFVDKAAIPVDSKYKPGENFVITQAEFLMETSRLRNALKNSMKPLAKKLGEENADEFLANLESALEIASHKKKSPSQELPTIIIPIAGDKSSTTNTGSKTTANQPQISPRSPQISPRSPPVSPRSPPISPRSPPVSPKANRAFGRQNSNGKVHNVEENVDSDTDELEYFESHAVEPKRVVSSDLLEHKGFGGFEEKDDSVDFGIHEKCFTDPLPRKNEKKSGEGFGRDRSLTLEFEEANAILSEFFDS